MGQKTPFSASVRFIYRWNMKNLRTALLLVFAFLLPWATVQAQIAVAEFYLDETDQVANEEPTEVFDQNGYRCAIIKVETTQTGFSFDVGSLGVTKTVQQKGEIWVYVPFGVKHITIGHEHLGILRNYYFPIPIEKARVYIMRLTTGTMRVEVEEAPTQQYVVFKVEPKEAVVEFDGSILEVVDGTAMVRVPFGKYNYRVQAKDYHLDVGRLEVSDTKNKVVKEVRLSPAFGFLALEGGKGADGAAVYVDNAPAGSLPLAPLKLASGRHNVKIARPLYHPFEQTVEIQDGQTLSVQPTWQADFAEVTLKVDGNAEIVVNEEVKGRGQWRGPLKSGQYLVECRLPNHRPSRREISIEAGSDVPPEYTLGAPTPITASLDIVSTPSLAEVYLDGQRVGETPLSLPKQLIGRHEVRLSKAGYADLKEQIELKERDTLLLKRTLSKAAVPAKDASVPADLTFSNGLAQKADADKVFDVVEQSASFPGGTAALSKYVYDHLRYPAIAMEEGVQGRVDVQFVVERDGSVSSVKVVRSVSPALDREAVRVVQSLPRFTPGRQNGQPVRCRYTLPITFRLQ